MEKSKSKKVTDYFIWRNDMKKILLLMLAVLTLSATAKPKAKKTVETWPDGTPGIMLGDQNMELDLPPT